MVKKILLAFTFKGHISMFMLFHNHNRVLYPTPHILHLNVKKIIHQHTLYIDLVNIMQSLAKEYARLA